jgi:hypothetical protein
MRENFAQALREAAWRDPSGHIESVAELEEILGIDPSDLDQHEGALRAWRWLIDSVAKNRRRKTKCLISIPRPDSSAASRR